MHEKTDARDAELSSWFAGQLDAAGWTRESTPTIRYLMDQFLGLRVLRTHNGSADLIKAIDVVDELIRGRSLGPDHWSPQKREIDSDAAAIWIKVQPGQELNRQDLVRVQHDAYSDDKGVLHNGRVGSVMGVRYGMAVVHYDGDPPGTGHHHSIRLLEKRTAAQ
jgi:hypothetical protein